MLLSQIRQPAPLLPFLNVDMPTSAPRETSHTPPLSAVPPEEVQRLSEFAADGRSLKTEWQSIIDDSTKRLGKTGSSRCRVTVTDRFGGRGHDFQVIDSGHNLLHAFCDYLCTLTSLTFTHSPLHGQVVDKESNSNGGMLVIATSTRWNTTIILYGTPLSRPSYLASTCVLQPTATPPLHAIH